MPVAVLVIVIVALPLAAASKSSARFVVDWMVPALFTLTVPPVGLTLMRNASLSDLMIASFVFSRVKLRLLASPEASIARPPALVDSIVPELVIFTSVDAPFQLIAAFSLTESAPPAPTVTVSRPDTGIADLLVEFAGTV
ncbi:MULTISPECIES: hypothetical protein [Methylobacterium]|uniref:Uncharacterized protein n=1 Tax=Methylobacterium brachiatum TaxID=269660 RepID=A0ABV1R336_9HYPH|nr:hypothetical protein [Methylobacterium sp. GXF4]